MFVDATTKYVIKYRSNFWRWDFGLILLKLNILFCFTSLLVKVTEIILIALIINVFLHNTLQILAEIVALT